jgi:hypothetical protein
VALGALGRPGRCHGRWGQGITAHHYRRTPANRLLYPGGRGVLQPPLNKKDISPLELLSLLSAIISHPEARIINVTALRVAIGIFAIGLVVTVAAGICGYFNFLVGQDRDVSQALLAKQLLIGNATRIWATRLTVASLIFFVVGVATAVVPW